MKKPLFNGNKKKLIIAIAAASAAIVLAVVLVLVLLLGGGKNKNYNVNGAADLLDATYIDQIEDGRVDYELINSIAFQGNTYSIKWSVDVTKGVKLVENGNVTKVDVDEASEDDVDYTLTATVSDPNGNTATVKFYATLLKAKALIPVEITDSPEEGTAYRLYVYQNDAKKDCYFNGNIAATYYLGSVEDYESAEAVKVYVEYKEGSTTEFYMYFEHVLDGKQYINVVEKWHKKNGGWTYNPEISGTPSNTYTYSTEKKTIISEVPARSVTEENYDAPQDTTQVIYFGNSGGTYTTIGSVVIEDFGKEGFVANLVTLESAKDKQPEEKIAFEKDSLLLNESYTGAQTIEVRTYGKRYPDVKIDWTVVSGGELVSYADGKLTITAPTATTTATVKATITVGDKTETKEFTITLKPAIDVPAAGSTLTIPQANELGAKFEQDVYTEGKYYVTGVVKSVPNTTYGNLYIKDADGNELYIYGLYDEAGARYDAMTTKPVAGDTITVYGVIGKHNSAQMKNATMTAYTAGEVVPPSTTLYTRDVTDVAVNTPYAYYYFNTNDGKNHYFAGYSSGNFYFTDTTNASEAVNLYLETATDGYYAYYLNGETKNYLVVYTSNGYTNCKTATTSAEASVFKYNTEYNTLTTTVDTKEYYLGSYGTKDSVRPSEIKHAATSYVAHFANLVTADKFTAAEKLDYEKTRFMLATTSVSVTDTETVNLPATATQFSDITIAWSTTDTIASIANNVLTITKPNAETNVTLVATLTVSGSSVTKEFTIKVTPVTISANTETETFAIAASTGTLADDSLSISWASDNFTFVNEKNTSSTAIRTSDTDHFRIYQGNKFTISAKNSQKLVKIVVTCTEAKYATALVNSLSSVSGVTATADGTVVTITFTGDATSLTFTTTAQVRVKNFEITYA